MAKTNKMINKINRTKEIYYKLMILKYKNHHILGIFNLIFF
jgi:hypothetical protein